jgi:regulatory protein
MGKITSITRQAKNKNRVSIFVDGEYFGSLDEKTFVESGLKSGDGLDDETWKVISEQAENQSAFNKGISYISKLMRSEKQLTDYLNKKGYEDAAVEYALRKMKEYKYIDDEEYAKMILSHQIHVKRAGMMEAKAALRKNGIPDNIIEDALAAYDDDAQLENAKLQYEKLAKKYQNVDDDLKKRQKIFQAMARRGFGWDLIKKAARSFGTDY